MPSAGTLLEPRPGAGSVWDTGHVGATRFRALPGEPSAGRKARNAKSLKCSLAGACGGVGGGQEEELDLPDAFHFIIAMAQLAQRKQT